MKRILVPRSCPLTRVYPPIYDNIMVEGFRPHHSRALRCTWSREEAQVAWGDIIEIPDRLLKDLPFWQVPAVKEVKIMLRGMEVSVFIRRDKAIEFRSDEKEPEPFIPPHEKDTQAWEKILKRQREETERALREREKNQRREDHE